MGVFLVFGEPGTTKNATVMSCFFVLCRVFRGGAEGERAGEQWEGGVTWEGGGGDVFNMKGGLMVFGIMDKVRKTPNTKNTLEGRVFCVWHEWWGGEVGVWSGSR